MTWVDTLVVTGVVLFGIIIFYKALKEPIDLLGGLVKRAFVSIKDKVVDMKDSSPGYEEIVYG